MSRLLFEKTGSAVYISHLDLMRVFQRAFRRAGCLLHHTGGFNQHAYVSLALPLSVGTGSRCEILDFELDEPFRPSELRTRLNAALPAGIRVLEVYEGGQKLKFLTHLHAEVFLEYDAGIPAGTQAALGALFSREALPVEKKTKKGVGAVDLKPMVRHLEIRQADRNTLVLDAVVCAQNPSMNPMQLVTAIETHAPAWKPDFAKCRRLEVLTAEGETFR